MIQTGRNVCPILIVCHLCSYAHFPVPESPQIAPADESHSMMVLGQKDQGWTKVKENIKSPRPRRRLTAVEIELREATKKHKSDESSHSKARHGENR